MWEEKEQHKEQRVPKSKPDDLGDRMAHNKQIYLTENELTTPIGSSVFISICIARFTFWDD